MSATFITLGRAESKLNFGVYATSTDLFEQFLLWEIGQYFGSGTKAKIDRHLEELDLENAAKTNQYAWLKTADKNVVIYRRVNRQLSDPTRLH